MSLSRRLRLLLPGTRHRATAVAAAMLLVLAAAGGQAAQAAPDETATINVAEPVVVGPSGCADDDRNTAQSSDRLLLSPVPATAPDHATVRLARPVVHQDRRTSAGAVVAAAPSLHALGISRT